MEYVACGGGAGGAAVTVCVSVPPCRHRVHRQRDPGVGTARARRARALGGAVPVPRALPGAILPELCPWIPQGYPWEGTLQHLRALQLPGGRNL